MDKYGVNLSFNTFSKSHYRTKYGATLTLLFYILGIILAVTFLTDFLDSENNYQLNYNYEPTEKEEGGDADGDHHEELEHHKHSKVVHNENFFFAFMQQDQYGLPIKQNLLEMRTFYLKGGSNKNSEFEYNYTELKTIPCRSLVSRKYQNYTNTMFKWYTCVDFNQSKVLISGDWNSEEFNFIKFNVTHNKSADLDQVERSLTDAPYVAYLLPSYNYDSNQERPLSSAIQYRYEFLDSRFLATADINLFHVKSINDKGLMSSANPIKEELLCFKKSDPHFQMQQMKFQGELFRSYLKGYKSRMNIYKKRNKLQDLVADLGGFMEIFEILFYLSSNLVTGHILKIALINDLFHFKEIHQQANKVERTPVIKPLSSDFDKIDRIGNKTQVRSLELIRSDEKQNLSNLPVFNNREFNTDDNLIYSNGTRVTGTAIATRTNEINSNNANSEVRITKNLKSENEMNEVSEEGEDLKYINESNYGSIKIDPVNPTDQNNKNDQIEIPKRKSVPSDPIQTQTRTQTEVEVDKNQWFSKKRSSFNIDLGRIGKKLMKESPELKAAFQNKLNINGLEADKLNLNDNQFVDHNNIPISERDVIVNEAQLKHPSAINNIRRLGNRESTNNLIRRPKISSETLSDAIVRPFGPEVQVIDDPDATNKVLHSITQKLEKMDKKENRHLSLGLCLYLKGCCCRKYLNPSEEKIFSLYQFSENYLEKRLDIQYYFRMLNEFEQGKKMFMKDADLVLLRLLGKKNLLIEQDFERVKLDDEKVKFNYHPLAHDCEYLLKEIIEHQMNEEEMNKFLSEINPELKDIILECIDEYVISRVRNLM